MGTQKLDSSLIQAHELMKRGEKGKAIKIYQEVISTTETPQSLISIAEQVLTNLNDREWAIEIYFHKLLANLKDLDSIMNYYKIRSKQFVIFF